jgi:hypothetical protein
MPKATNIVIEFDDGTRYNVDPAKAGSIFTTENAAKKCGHNPPYDKPPKSASGTSGVDSVSSMSTNEVTADATLDSTAETTATTSMTGTTCYLINGVIVCP